MYRRPGLTVIELLVIVGILSVLMALILPAIMQVRATALRMESMNNLKQLALAVHSYAGNRSGRLPDIAFGNADPRESLLFVLLPYLEHDNYYEDVKNGKLPLSSDHLIKPFLSPADPTLTTPRGASGLTSYCSNAQLFTDRARMPGAFRDGSSNTIMFAEHYGQIWNKSTNEVTQFYWYFQDKPDVNLLPGITITIRRATFADRASGDVYPVTTGIPSISMGSVPELSFQLRPQDEEANPRLAQSPHSSGMLVAMGDGGVRVLNRGIAHQVYWGLVTPAGRESVSLD